MPNGQEHPLRQHGFTHMEGVDPIQKLENIEENATGDLTGAEIVVLLEALEYLKGAPTAICFNLSLATTGTKQAQIVIPRSLTVSKVILYSDDAPTGASLIVDVNKNGTTIFTTQANRPEVAIDGHSDESETPDITSLVKGDRLSVDVDQVGSVVPGGDDLLVAVIC